MTRILGIDPGSLRMGFGVVEKSGTKLVGIAAGVIRVPQSMPMPKRLMLLRRAVVDLIAQYAPNECAVEDVFFSNDVRAALKLGQARGVILATFAEHDLEIGEYPPAVIKRAVAGSGNADKTQVARMVMTMLRFDSAPTADATDALAIAITHANRSPLASLIAAKRSPLVKAGA